LTIVCKNTTINYNRGSSRSSAVFCTQNATL
jgi:hypothetical protein